MAEQINDGGPAFPVGTKTITVDTYTGNESTEEFGYEPGMSLRDWLAGQALAGLGNLLSWPMEGQDFDELLDDNEAANDTIEGRVGLAAKVAYHYADAMLAARTWGKS